MNSRSLWLPLVALWIVGSAAAQERKPLEPNPRPTLPEIDPIVTGSEEGVYVDDAWWTKELSDEPQAKLVDAAKRLEENRPEKAAKDIRKAAAHMKIAAARSEGGMQEAIQASRRELLALARELEGRRDVTVADVEVPFARALQALAEQHVHKAEVQFLAGKNEKAGYDLRAAGVDLDHAASWLHANTEPRIAKAVQDAASEAELLIIGEPVGKEDVTRVLVQTGEEIATLGNRIEKLDRHLG